MFVIKMFYCYYWFNLEIFLNLYIWRRIINELFNYWNEKYINDVFGWNEFKWCIKNYELRRLISI